MSSSYVPSVVSHLFDRFPLSTYPGQHDQDALLKKKIAKHTYPLRPRSQLETSSTSEPVSIGVYKLHDYAPILKLATPVYLPSDPACLNVLLCMLLKNNLLLPNSSESVFTKDDKICLSSKTGYNVLELNYNASPDGVLPILVEPENTESCREKTPLIRTHKEISTVLLDRTQAQSEDHALLSELLDNVLYDSFVLELLQEHDFYAQIFELTTEENTNKQNYKRFILKLMQQNKFSSRNKSLYLQLSRITLQDLSSISNTPSIKDKTLQWTTTRCNTQTKDLLLQIETQFHSLIQKPNLPGNTPSYISIKLASYIVPFLFMGNSNIAKFINISCPELAKHSIETVSYFI